jgi:aminopeptidase
MSYTPDKKILENYARVLVNFALNSGKGIKKDEVVLIAVPECARPILRPLYIEVLKAGAHPIVKLIPDGLSKDFFEYGSDKQISYFPKDLLKGEIDNLDHAIKIISEHDPKELNKIDPKKIMLKQKSLLPYKKWREEKENKEKFSWTLGLYGTPASAKEAKLNLKEYWDQIIKACFLDKEDPVKEWQDSQKKIKDTVKKLNSLEIEKVRVITKSTDLWIRLGDKRKWLGARGANIPSFEIFISPDWRGTNGHIEFTEKLYRYGNIIEGVKLDFKEGLVVNASATKGEKILKEIIAQKNANKVGEFSLTDSRFSRITKFMAETLYDENVGGRYGNTHIAVGSSFRESHPGEIKDIKEKEWEELGYNDSVIHMDIVSTEDRTVTAHLKNGETKIIFKDGKFTV